MEIKKNWPPVWKIGIATLAVVWSAPTFLFGIARGPVKPPEGQEDAAMMYIYVHYVYMFFLLAVFIVAVHWFYKHFLSTDDSD